MLYIILSIILFSLNNVLWKQNLKRIPIPLLVFYRAILTSIISIGVLLTTVDLNDISNLIFLRSTIGSLFGALGLFSMLIVIKQASLQWFGIYSIAGIVCSTIYLILFEHIRIIETLPGCSIIFLGFTIYIYNNKNSPQKINVKQHVLLFFMTICYSTSSVLHWSNLDANAPAILIIANQELIVFIISGTFAFFLRRNVTIMSGFKIHFRKVFIMAILIFFALLFSFLGLNETNPLISSILFLASPLMTIFFGNIFFRERISIKDVLAILVVSYGAFMLNFRN